MHIVVVEDDGGLRGVLRLWMAETRSIVTGISSWEIKTYDNIDILVVGPNAQQINRQAIKERHLPCLHVGFYPNMDIVMQWIQERQKEIRERAERCIVEDRAV